MSKGALILDEMVVPIVDIAFISEIVVVTAELRGPIKGSKADTYIINGQDGRTLFSGVCDLSWPDLTEWQAIRLQLGFNVEGKRVIKPMPNATLPPSVPAPKWDDWDPRRGE